LARRESGLGAGDQADCPLVLGRGDARLEEASRHSEPVSEPVERGRRGTHASPLDLADVFLGEPAEAELRLRQATRDPELPDSLPERGGGRPAARTGPKIAGDASTVNLSRRKVKWRRDPPNGAWE